MISNIESEFIQKRLKSKTIEPFVDSYRGNNPIILPRDRKNTPTKKAKIKIHKRIKMIHFEWPSESEKKNCTVIAEHMNENGNRSTHTQKKCKSKMSNEGKRFLSEV